MKDNCVFGFSLNYYLFFDFGFVVLDSQPTAIKTATSGT